jgi:hypothetical protein
MRMVILSGAHQRAKDLPPGISRVLEIFARVAASGDGTGLEQEITRIPHDSEPLLWEPVDVYGWTVQGTMYLRDKKLWWLVHAVRKNEREPSTKEISFLAKVLEHLGAEPKRHMIIGPGCSPPGEQALAFGWWTWQNRWPLYEIQVNEHKKHDREKIRVVPLGTRETDGYHSLDLDAEKAERRH